MSYRKGHRYLTVVADHDRDGAVVWAGENRSAATLSRFFAELGPERCARLEAISVDMSACYAKAIDDNEEKLEDAGTAREIFEILRHSAPLLRSLRKLVAALEDVLQIDHDDHEILVARDRGKELERAAELRDLLADLRRTTSKVHRFDRIPYTLPQAIDPEKDLAELAQALGLPTPPERIARDKQF